MAIFANNNRTMAGRQAMAQHGANVKQTQANYGGRELTPDEQRKQRVIQNVSAMRAPTSAAQPGQQLQSGGQFSQGRVTSGGMQPRQIGMPQPRPMQQQSYQQMSSVSPLQRALSGTQSRAQPQPTRGQPSLQFRSGGGGGGGSSAGQYGGGGSAAPYQQASPNQGPGAQVQDRAFDMSEMAYRFGPQPAARPFVEAAGPGGNVHVDPGAVAGIEATYSGDFIQPTGSVVDTPPAYGTPGDTDGAYYEWTGDDQAYAAQPADGAVINPNFSMEFIADKYLGPTGLQALDTQFDAGGQYAGISMGPATQTTDDSGGATNGAGGGSGAGDEAAGSHQEAANDPAPPGDAPPVGFNTQDGSFTVDDGNGGRMTQYPDRRVHWNADGSSLTTYPDGRQVEFDADGNVVSDTTAGQRATDSWNSGIATPVGGGGGGSGGSPFGDVMAQLMDLFGQDLSKWTGTMNAQDRAMLEQYFGDMWGKDADPMRGFAEGLLDPESRAAAEQAARDSMYSGINSERDAALRMAEARGSRGGLLGSGTTQGIHGRAMQAAQEGERGLTQDNYERMLQSGMAGSGILNDLNQQKWDLLSSGFTSNKEFLQWFMSALTEGTDAVVPF